MCCFLSLSSVWLLFILFHVSDAILIFSYSLSGNKGLCGVPSLPECPLLSSGGKIAIGISSLVLFCILLLAVYICCIRRGRYDYDFGIPPELMGKHIFYSYLPNEHFPILLYFAYLIEGTLFSCRMTTQHLLPGSVISWSYVTFIDVFLEPSFDTMTLTSHIVNLSTCSTLRKEE